MSDPEPVSRVRLNTLVGALCASCLLAVVPGFEGEMLVGYKDPIGVVTACVGHTKTAVLGKRYTVDECTALLVTDLLEHAKPVLACTPTIRDKPYKLAAAVSFAFNIGGTAYCKSTTAKRFNAGDYMGACRAINENDNGGPQWVTAGGKVLPGLVSRRKAERALCERAV